MSEKQKHIKSYSTADIRDYLDGKLSPAEMYAMEKAAIDDPLLSDAIEGMELSDQQNISFESDTEQLKKRLQERIKQQEKNRILPFILKWRVAASVLLLAGAGILSYFFLIRKPDTDSNISLVPAAPAAMDTISRISRPKIPRHITDTVSVAFNDKSIPNRSLSKTERATDEKKKSKYEPVASRLSPVKVAPNPESFSVAAVEPKELSTSIPVDKNKAASQPAPVAALQGKAAGVRIRGSASFNNQNPAAFKKQDKVSGNFYLQGTVTDSNGIPISDATVMLMHTKEAVSTDVNGTFRLKTIFPDSSQDIVVNSVGYQPASVAINPAENKDKLIRLSPAGNSLADVVVVGYGARKREVSEDEEISATVQKKPITQKGEPVNGWPAYNTYINKNKKINSTDSLLKGVEIVSFLVNQKGELSSFKIEKSISPAHDTEVIRLIKEGPAWKLLRGKKHRCRLTVDFN